MAERRRLIADRKPENLRAPRRFSGFVAQAFLPVWLLAGLQVSTACSRWQTNPLPGNMECARWIRKFEPPPDGRRENATA